MLKQSFFFLCFRFLLIFTFIEFREAGICFKKKCPGGCTSIFSSSLDYAEDCCDEGGYGFAEKLHPIRTGCFRCEKCVDLPPKVNGGWGEWSEWSECSKTCGAGQRTRTRKCDSPNPSRRGKSCEGEDTETEICKDDCCSVDGDWGLWSDWSVCSETCGNGIQKRSRMCDSPPPKCGGMKCFGESEQHTVCNLVECPIDGGWSDWNVWSVCSKRCGGGVRRATRRCNNPQPQLGGKDCIGTAMKTEKCNTKCCQIDGEWSPWSEWTKCSATCGESTRTRSRECDNPTAECGGVDCFGADHEVKKCAMIPCLIDENPIDGGWSDWIEDGTKCSKSCGGGVLTLTRKCNNPKPQNGGKECIGRLTKLGRCNKNPCPLEDEPVDGSWSDWNIDGEKCSATCDGGVIKMTRDCNNPFPQNSGKDCEGKFMKLVKCNEDPCPNNEWSSWADWKCTETKAIRLRVCENEDEIGCFGHDTEIKDTTDPTYCNDCKTFCTLVNDKFVPTSLLSIESDSNESPNEESQPTNSEWTCSATGAKRVTVETKSLNDPNYCDDCRNFCTLLEGKWTPKSFIQDEDESEYVDDNFEFDWSGTGEMLD